MSQCYSGGFHMMSVGEKDGQPTANPAICGFTAITPDSIASGCTADVDGPSYQGYERYFTQRLTGKDVVTGQKLTEPATTVREAHLAAALDDMTLDIPMSTSDYYLWQWAQKIEARTGSNALYLEVMAGRMSDSEQVTLIGSDERVRHLGASARAPLFSGSSRSGNWRWITGRFLA